MAKKRKVARNPVKRKGVPKSPKIHKDLLKEYAASIKKDGVVEVLRLSDDDSLAHVKTHISTQSVTLDKLLNGKGYPTGRVTEIYGPQHIGKSTLLDHAFAEVQSMGGVGVLFDTETARDVNYSRSIGVDASKLQLVEFSKKELHIENVMGRLFDTIDWWSEHAPDTPVVIGWDALGGTSTKDELSKRLEKDAKMAGAAKIMHTAARQLPPKLGNTKIVVIIINHTYDTIGGNYTRKETYGGAGVRHLATIRIALSRDFSDWIRDGNKQCIGHFVKAYLEKNRLGKAYKSTRFAIIPGIGIDNVWSLFEALKSVGYIVTKGSWSAINVDGEIIKFQGIAGFKDKCSATPGLLNKLAAAYHALGT